MRTLIQWFECGPIYLGIDWTHFLKCVMGDEFVSSILEMVDVDVDAVVT